MCLTWNEVKLFPEAVEAQWIGVTIIHHLSCEVEELSIRSKH